MIKRFVAICLVLACCIFITAIFTTLGVMQSSSNASADVGKVLGFLSQNSFMRLSSGGKAEHDAEKKYVLLIWSNVWAEPAKEWVKNLGKGSEQGQCPVACETTINRSRVDEADAFVMHAWDAYPVPPHKNIPWILYSLENPNWAPILRDAKYMSQFQLYLSYRLDSDFIVSLFAKPNLDPPVPFKEKTGGIMAAFTNCEEVRTEYLKQLMKFIKVDSYGGCLNNNKALTQRYQKDFKAKKTKLERSYKFMIVFFNEDCDYFVDDQILHALNAGAVPVVMSTDKIYEFLPGNLRNAIVNVRNFKSPKDLADRLRFLISNEKEYNKYLEWKFKGLGDISDTVIGKYWESKYDYWCHTCMALSQGKLHKEGLKPDTCGPRRFESWGIKPGN